MRNFITSIDGIEPSINQQAIELFGITDNPIECGYVLTTGETLDLSGKHEAMGYEREGDKWVVQPGYEPTHTGKRFHDHGDVGDIAEDRYDFMRRSGAVRVSPMFGFEFLIEHPPTRIQSRVVCQLSKFYRGDLYLDLTGANNRSVKTMRVDVVTPRDLVQLFET